MSRGKFGSLAVAANQQLSETNERKMKMTAIQKALIVGGGFSGMAAAIRMKRAGIDVDLLELDPAWCPLGAGITVNGPTLRALETLGVYENFKAEGWVSQGVDLYTQQNHHVG